ncbi:MAG: putative molybdenum carrier protein [Alphaproteobacteria bacterium]|nr:putative molybdenum carrier protein [Alphaproteobacteria bacterium]
MIARVITGGQTGVDRAALDVALALGIDCGGLCPRDRRAEDGRIPDRYPLTESRLRAYAWRTLVNVWRADGLLILCPGDPTGGTRLALRAALRLGKPHLLVALGGPEFDVGVTGDGIERWLEAHGIGILNVAGPRESDAPGIHDQAVQVLRATFGSRGV